MLHPRLPRVRGGQVQVDFHGEVRREAQTSFIRQCGQAQELGDAADARSIWLDDVAAVGVDEALVLGDRRQHLARGNGCVQDLGQVRVAFEVISVQRLFDPDEVEFLELAAHAERGGPVPLLVGVHHERDVPADVFADASYAAEVFLGIRQANFDLDAADAFLDGLAGAGLDLVQGGVEEAAGGVVGLH
ncbi:hypothetical protein D3C73_1099670 [compost metagenome]